MYSSHWLLLTLGVIHSFAASAIVGLSAAPADAERLMRSCPVSGVGHAPCETEPSCSPMAGSHVGRGKSDPFRVPPAVGQFSHDAGGGALFERAFGFVHSGGGGSSDGTDVLQNKPARTASVGDVEDVEEQPAALAIQPGALAGDADVLARESRNDEIHASSKSLCAESPKIAAPHRRRLQSSRFHERNKLAGCRGFPFSKGNCSELNPDMAERSSHSFIKHSDAGAKADRIDIGTSHMRPPLGFGWQRCDAPGK